MSDVEINKDSIRIGAMVTQADLIDSGALADVARSCAKRRFDR